MGPTLVRQWVRELRTVRFITIGELHVHWDSYGFSRRKCSVIIRCECFVRHRVRKLTRIRMFAHKDWKLQGKFRVLVWRKDRHTLQPHCRGA